MEFIENGQKAYIEGLKAEISLLRGENSSKVDNPIQDQACNEIDNNSTTDSEENYDLLIGFK